VSKQLAHQDFKSENIKLPFCLLANDFRVPMNIGSLFRIADALGIEKIYLCGDSPAPPNSKINRTARSTVKAVDFEIKADALETVSFLKKQGYTIVSLEWTDDSIELDNFELLNSKKVCLIAGAESEGINNELLRKSDCIIHIPMLGLNSSMNVATATAIATYQIAKQLKLIAKI